MFGGWFRRLVAGVAVGGLFVAPPALGGSGSGSGPIGSVTPRARTIPAASGCDPEAGPGAAPFRGGLDPGQLAAAYGVSSLWERGFYGHGRRVALIEWGQSLDPTAFAQFSSCYGPFVTPKQYLVLGSNPKTGGEGIFDPEVVAAIAPKARIYMFESGQGTVLEDVVPKLLAAALRPRNTGGKLVDTISMSFSPCEAGWTAAEVRAVQIELRRAASLGVAVFASAGDAGSVYAYTYQGKPACVGHPVDVDTDKDLPGLRLEVGYPTSSPLVTSVGGTELAINGCVPAAGAPAGGTITSEIAWNEASPNPTTLSCPSAPCGSPSSCFAGGGGRSELFTVASARWERAVGLSGQERKPDISALAGSPKYLGGGIGTSGSSPLMAGAVAVLDGYLADHHAQPTGPLNPTLYHIAADPTLYLKVFNDITSGTNDLLGLGCCSAGPGYDMASGLGSLRVAALGAALLAKPSLRVPWTTLKLTAAPVNATIGTPLTITAVTNNVLIGTPYHINIFVAGKLFATCKWTRTGVCHENLFPRPPFPAPYRIAADVGPAGAHPSSRQAIVSMKTQVTVDRTRPTSCKGSSCT